MIGTIHLTALVLGLSLHLVHVAAYSEITPVQAGSAISARGLKAKRACDADSWIPDDHRAEYTRPANGTQIMRAAVSGPAAIYITKTRSQSSTTSTDLTSEDIVSLGVGLEMVEMVEDSAPSTFHVAEGQTGDIGFTPFLVCTSGKEN